MATKSDLASNIYQEIPYSRSVLRISYSVGIIAFLLGLGTLVFHTLEGWSWLDSLYFATTSLTTVSYGDFVPHHDSTRIFLIFYLLIGVSTVLYALTNVARYYIEKREDNFENAIIKLRNVGLKAKEKIKKVPHPPTSKIKR